MNLIKEDVVPKQKMFCVVCNKFTVHRLAIAKIWMCDTAHEGDDTHCHNCGEELGGESLRISKFLGADQTVCKKCNQGQPIKIIGKFQPLIRDTSQDKKKN